ncbi:MAG: HYR domain-containing protein [Anaerolineales bacterium]|nr:HYR domain-containing protein [Anaerolineales bacterium]
MLRINRHFVWSVFLILVVIINLMNVNVALADDTPPTPPPTEEPTEPPVEPTASPVATETPGELPEPPVPTESPVEPTQPPTIEATPTATDAPVVAEETPNSEEQASSEEGSESEVSEILAEMPENTELVVLNENGDTISLASQEAADIVVEADPMWCPEGVLPNGPGCTTNLTVSALLALMQTNAGGQFSANGVIYFERSGLTTYTTSFILDDSAGSLGASYNTLKNYNITLQGGWNGGVTSTFHAAESSVFDNNNNAVIRVGSSVNPWVGNVTVQDIRVQDNDGGPGPVNGPSVSVYTSTGDIVLNDVDVDEQADGEHTAYLNSTDGNITVTNGSSFDGAGNNKGFFAATMTGSITVTGTSGNRITFTDAVGSGAGVNYNGATLNAPMVTLNYVSANGNDLNGIAILNANQVTLNNVNSTSNGTEIAPIGFANNLGSGVLVNGIAGSFISVVGGNFSGNQRYGIEYYNGSLFAGTIPLCIFNDGGCTNTPATLDLTPPTIAFVSRTPANGAGWNNTDVIVTWSCADPGSGVVSPTVNAIVSSEGSGQSATGTCTNRAGLTASNTQSGINIDKTAPSASASASPAPNGNGWNNSNVTVSFTGIDDRSGVASCSAAVILSADGANQSASGTCTDNAGNVSAPASVTGINIDKTAPVASATASPAPNGNGWNNTPVTVSFSATDATSGVASCDPAIVLSSEGAGQSASGGCTDLAGNASALATASGINIDLTQPNLILPSDITTEATGPAGAAVGFSATSTDNLDASPTVICAPASGSTFPLGTTAVSCTATDQAGNSRTSGFSITVVDTTPPTLTLPANPTLEATSPSGAVATFSASASDIVDGALPVTCIPPSGSVFALGTTTVNCSSSDTSGNTANGSFTITVQDTTPPTLTLPANMILEATGPSGAVATFTVSASDIVNGATSVTCVPPSGSVFALGTMTVHCSSTDTSGNTSIGSFTVTVQDTTPPTLTLPGDMTIEATGPSGAVATFSASASDVVDGSLPVTCVPPSGNTFPLGTAAVNCSAMDSNGNTAAGSFNVTVQDTTPPAIAPMPNILVHSLTELEVNVYFTAPNTNDFVDGPGVATCNPPSGSLFYNGNTTVTCTATDAHGNTSSIAFNVHVNYHPLPPPTQSGYGGLILVTGGELIDLACYTVANAFGVVVKFHNLCNHQAVINEVSQNGLPEALPSGFTFVKGIDVQVLFEGQAVKSLPKDSGVEMDFPLSDGSTYALLYWNNGQWVEITQPMNASDLQKVLSTNAANELYKMSSSSASSHNALTTELTGVFVLVKK